MLENIVLSNEEFRELDILMSSSHEHNVIKKKIVTFLIVKLCYCGSHSGINTLYPLIDVLNQPKTRNISFQNTQTGESVVN